MNVSSEKPTRMAWRWGVVAGVALLVLQVVLMAFAFFGMGTKAESDAVIRASLIVMALQPVAVGVTAVSAFRHRRATNMGVFATLATLALGGLSLVPGLIGLLATSGGLAGGAWGRPLRIRGRQRHPELRLGADWTRGPMPSPAGLDEPTRRALEALWLHDAQKEHASVPAFSRVSWLLAAAGAPAELLEWSHRAALEEVDHTRLCFALAAGYAGRSHTVEPMPELLLGGLDVRGNVLELLAAESLSDGCQLEDFNADVAAACAAVCEEPATRAVLEQVAREERSHAELSWAIVTWLVKHHGATVRPALERACEALSRYPRPTAVSEVTRPLVAAATPELLRKNGRLSDAEWGEQWRRRLTSTEHRLAALLDSASGAFLQVGEGRAPARAPLRLVD